MPRFPVTIRPDSDFLEIFTELFDGQDELEAIIAAERKYPDYTIMVPWKEVSA